MNVKKERGNRMDFDMDYDAGSMDVEESDVSDTFDDVSDEGELDFSEIPCLDTDIESEELELEDIGDNLFIDEGYEESELDVMLDGIQGGRTDLEELDEGQENWELEEMLKEWEENSDDDDQKVYVKTYPR